jgi:outer membrane protein assembly factor BamB
MATETMGGGNTIVIDLGLDRGEPATYATPTRSTVPGWFGPLLLAMLILGCATGSAAPAPSPLSQVLSLRVGPADSYAVTDTGQLLAQTLGTLSSYDLGDGRQQWETGTVAPTYRLRTGSGVVLLRPWAVGSGEPGTTAVDVTTGAVRWQHRGSVMTIAGSSALLAVSGVRTLLTAGRRIEGAVESLDPDTGATRWRVDVPSTAVLMGVPGPAGAPPRMLLVHDNRTLALHDLSTGRLLATAPLPPADYGPDNPAVSGGLILLREPTGWGSEISAFDPVTLAVRWRRPTAGAYEAEPCGALACLSGPDGVAAVDPAGGAVRWYQPGWRSVEQRGALLLAYSSTSGVSDPVGVVDPQTGRVLVDLHGWRAVTGTGGGDLLVTRAVEAGARTIVAIARPGDAQPRLLADLPPGTGDCQAVPDRLICRSASGELIVWAYRKKG